MKASLLSASNLFLNLNLSTLYSLSKPQRPRIYGMDSAMLKSLKVHLAYPITQTINLSVLQGIFPSMWKTAIVSPIFKSGDPQDITNYSPISILPVISKVAEKWVSEQLVSFLNNSPFSLHPMRLGSITLQKQPFLLRKIWCDCVIRSSKSFWHSQPSGPYCQAVCLVWVLPPW